MIDMKGGDRYKCRLSGYLCTIHRMERRGRGWTVVYIWDGFVFGLMRAKTDFLKQFEQVE